VSVSRVRLPTAITRRRSLSASGRTAAAVSSTIDTVPETTSVTPGLLPLYGTWTTSIPVRRLKSSIARCETVPLPDDALVSLPGLAFA